jgi:hypothetical protein
MEESKLAVRTFGTRSLATVVLGVVFAAFHGPEADASSFYVRYSAWTELR